MPCPEQADDSIGLAVGSTDIYVACGIAEEILVLPKNGGPQAFLPTGAVDIRGLAVRATDLYWVDYASFLPVGKTSLVDGSSTYVEVAGTYGVGIALDAHYVYVTLAGFGLPCNEPDEIGFFGAVTYDIESIAVWGDKPQRCPDLAAVDDEFLYFADSTAGTIERTFKTGGAAAVLHSGQPSPRGVAVDESSLYWTNFGDGTVLRSDKHGSAASVIVLAAGQAAPTGIGVDQQAIYWVNNATGEVVGLAKEPTSAAPAPAGTACADAMADCDGDGSCESNLATDGTSCGACGHDCLGAACVGGLCEPFSLGIVDPYESWGITLTPDKAYVTAYQSLAEVEIDGGGVTLQTQEAAVGELYSLRAIASNVSHLYGALWSGWSSFPFDIMRIAWPDGTPSAGGDLTLFDNALLKGPPDGLALDSSGLYVASCTKNGTGGDGVIRYAPIGPDDEVGSLVQLAQSQACPLGIAVDDDTLYWANALGGTIVTMPKTGGAITPLHAGEHVPGYLAVDTAGVYWTTRGDAGTLQRSNKDGSGVTLIASGQGDPTGVALDAQYVYWVNRLSGEVLRVAK